MPCPASARLPENLPASLGRGHSPLFTREKLRPETGHPVGSQQLPRGVAAFLPLHRLCPCPEYSSSDTRLPLCVLGTARASLPQGRFRPGGQGQALTLLLSDRGFPLYNVCPLSSIALPPSFPRRLRLCHLTWHTGGAPSMGEGATPEPPPGRDSPSWRSAPCCRGSWPRNHAPSTFCHSSALGGATTLLTSVLSRTSVL